MLNQAATLSTAQKDLLDEDASLVLCDLACASYFEGKRIVITGATGMLGGWVAYLLSRMKTFTGFAPGQISILASGRNSSAPIWRDNIERSHVQSWVPMMNSEALPKADLYLHMASPASARDFLGDPRATMLLNTIGTLEILERANTVPGSRVLFVSSGEIYGIAEGPVREATVGLVPLDDRRWIYAESKRMGELLCRDFVDTGRVDSVVVRPFHTFGPGLQPNDPRVFGAFLTSILAQEDLVIRGDSKTERTFCYAPETASAILLAAGSGEIGEAYNVAGAIPTSIAALAEALNREFLPTGRVVKYEQSRDANSITNPSAGVVVDTTKIRALGWAPQRDVLEAFGRTLKFVRAG